MIFLQSRVLWPQLLGQGIRSAPDHVSGRLFRSLPQTVHHVSNHVCICLFHQMKSTEVDQGLFTDSYCKVCSAQLISESQRVAHYEVNTPPSPHITVPDILHSCVDERLRVTLYCFCPQRHEADLYTCALQLIYSISTTPPSWPCYCFTLPQWNTQKWKNCGFRFRLLF